MAEKKAVVSNLHDTPAPPPYQEAAAKSTGQGPSSSVFRTTFASVSLHMTDRIRLLNFPREEQSHIKTAVESAWERGIQDERMYGSSYELKLRGNPWGTHVRDQSVFESRKLMCSILGGLFDLGWVLKAAVDVSKKEFDKDTLLFRRQQPPPPRCHWICINFTRGDTIHILDAPQELADTLKQAYGERVQRCRAHEPAFEIKFKGYPWLANGEETVRSREILLILLECLEQHGFSLYTSLDQDSGPGGNSHSSESDTWYCNREMDWTPGAPIYHA